MGDAIQIWDGGRDTISAQRRVARREVVKLRSHISLLSEQLAEARIQTEGDRNDSILTPDEIGAKIMALNQTLSADDVTRRDVRNRAEKIQRLEQDLTCLRSDTISADVPVPDRIDTSDTQNRLSILSEKQASIKRVGINGGWVGNCPLVGSRCPSQQWVIDSNTQRQAEIDRLDSQIRPLQQVVKDGRVRDDARKLAIARNTDLARKRVVASTEIKALEKRLDQLRSEPVPEMMSSQRRSEIQVEIDALKTRYDEIIIHARHQAEIQALEARHGSTQTELRRCEQELRICTDVLAVIGETTGPAALAEARIQDYVNTILEPIGWKLSLEWQKPTTKRVTECDGCGEICRTSRKTCPGCGENRAVVMSPDLRLVLDDGRTVRDIRHASGGQKQLVSLALRLATSPIPLLILDEVDSAVGPPLDSAVAAMVATHPIQTVVISHGDEIPALADVVIRVVESESGVSELEVSRRV
jgi:DNA repair exonuclease SbcCD ATPase subunit